MEPTVILQRCAEYDPARIRAIVREGIKALGDIPKGRVLVKPNGVIANRSLFRDAYTRPEFLDGVLGAIRDTSPDVTELGVGERCGITIPTRMVFNETGWHPVLKRHGAKAYYFEEEPQVEVPLRREPRLRDYLYTPEPVARCDYLVNLPKFKAHPWTTITLALKNFIGIQDDHHRLVDHDHRLDEKIADLQEIVTQRFIAVDGIVAGQERMLTPVPFQLGLVLMSNNPVALDAVACHIVGLDPAKIRHIEAAHQKGFGPIDLSKIRLEGDVTLDGARDLAKGFKVGLVRVEKYFEGTRIKAHAGPPPEEWYSDYCWGGCPGAIEEAIEIVRRVDARTDARMKPLTVVFGAYRGPIEAQPGEKVVFIGDCANWKGKIAGKDVEVASTYVERKHRDPHTVRSEGLITKMIKTLWKLLVKERRAQVVRLQGCPVSVAEQVMTLTRIGGTKDPYLAPANAIPFARAFLVSTIVRAFKRLFGMPDRIRASPPAPLPARVEK